MNQLNFLDAETGLTEEPFTPPPVTLGEVRKQNRAYASASDPRTSHLAAQDFENSGLLDSHNEMILWLATVHGGDWTVHELAALSEEKHGVNKLDAVRINKRVNGLRDGGHIELVGERKCTCKAGCRLMQSWKIVR